VIAAVETVTVRAAPWPAASVNVIVHVPGPCGVTEYVAEPFEDAVSAAEAIAPLGGLHVSLSLNAPVYPDSVTATFCTASDANDSEDGDVTGALAGEDDADGEAVGEAVGDTVVTGGAEDTVVLPPHAASNSVNAHAARFT
jgi:hypothetical protein